MYNDIYNKEQYAYTYGTILKWLKMEIAGESIISRLNEQGIKRIAIYGIALLGEILYQKVKDSDIEIICFIDQRYNLYENGIDKIPVYGVENAPFMQVDVIIITPILYFQSIMESLVDNGIPLEKIISLSMIVS